MAQKDNHYNVVIIGGGITGTSLFFALAKYTDIPNIALFEKYKNMAEVNSHYQNNSQTLHFGDIETNYTLEKAGRVKEASEILVRYMEKYAENAFIKLSKMVIAVGGKEADALEKRFAEFQKLFPGLKKIYAEEIGRIEPKVMEGRDKTEKISALYSEDGYTVNYKKLAESFVFEAQKSNKNAMARNGLEITGIKKKRDGYEIFAGKEMFTADAVAVMAGPHSLVFAKKLGYGKNLGLLPVAGSFYCADNILNGKVYTMQIKKLPFAAIHGDRDVNNPKETRFGPTAKVLPMLERHNYGTIFDFIRTSVWSIDGILSLLKIVLDPVLFRYVLKNIGYDLPFIGRWIFLREAKKIVPSLRYRDLRYGSGIGGIRPQIVNTKTKKLEMGEAEIVGDKILFNITPSPGASVSLKNAEQETIKIIGFLPRFRFNTKLWCRDFGSSMEACTE